MKISEIYGKRVESTAGKRGYVIAIKANGKKLECLICADENEDEFTVDINNVINFGDVIIFNDRESAIKSALPLRLGRASFDECGKYLGNLEEYLFEGNTLLKAKIGKKNYPAEGLVCGDAVIVKKIKRLKGDVLKSGKIIIKSGTYLTDEVMDSATLQGEYVQTTMKSI
ncbi:MAG: hypothetical protein J1G07_04160 [Clostridiales bacterium]|nr:hypothetical protein [Clostridiales bacterium]